MTDEYYPSRSRFVVEGQTVVTTEVFERPLAERPAHDRSRRSRNG